MIIFFKTAESILKNDIHNTLLIFDEILKSGFDGHHFLNGLGSHFRNLLVCKDKITLSLLEVGKKVQEKFLKQSEEFKSITLIDALKIIGDADTQYKLSKNQRLHIELTLMKLASLGISDEKKKQLILA